MSEITTPPTIPCGYKSNSQGHLVPIDKIDSLDLLRDDLVVRIVNRAATVQGTLRNFKDGALSDIEAFMSLAAEQYGTVYGGRKGNLQLSSFDGRYRLCIDVQDTLIFDERLQIAKGLIDKCIHAWTADSSSNVRALIEHAFQTDKQGNINTGRVLGLLTLKIDDADWQSAMAAIKDSIKVVSSKSYLRLYERTGNEGKYEQISLDVARL